MERLLSYAAVPEAAGPRLTPPTGAGSLPADSVPVRWLLGRGFRLEQVERGSRFPLPADADGLARHRAEAERAAGPEYAVRTWTGPAPERWHADLALLYMRMSTDAPSAGLEEAEDLWTAERVASREAVIPPAADRLTAVVEHLPSGELAGFTRLLVPHDVRRPAEQGATLVRREHRGHRLGMLLKIANLQLLEAERPGHPSVLTWNAEENRYMLDVNEAVGFEPIGYEGGWRKDLA